jgi:hypothetical protein
MDRELPCFDGHRFGRRSRRIMTYAWRLRSADLPHTTLAMSTTTSAALFAGAVLCFYLFRRSQRSKLPLPPGPKRLPLIGNLLDIPKNNEWLTFQDWHKQHGTYSVIIVVFD